MNTKKFTTPLPDDWQIDLSPASVQYLYDEILFEIKEYKDDTADDFVMLHDKSAYQILVILRKFINQNDADADVVNDLSKIS